MKHDDDIEYPAILKQFDKCLDVDPIDAINALAWNRQNQRRELKRLNEKVGRLEFVLKGLHDDQVDYLRLNSLGGINNHWLKAAREELGITLETVSKQPDKYAAHHAECEWRKFEGQAICNCADLTSKIEGKP
jgi:hypothetical protein